MAGWEDKLMFDLSQKDTVLLNQHYEMIFLSSCHIYGMIYITFFFGANSV